jgi:hypothetical protein
MDRLLDRRDKAKAEKWGLHWWDVALLNSKQQKRAALREKITVEDVEGLITALNEYDDTMVLSPKLLRSLCLWVTKGHDREYGQHLYELVTATFVLTYWVKTRHYEVKALRNVVKYERHLLIQREPT